MARSIVLVDDSRTIRAILKVYLMGLCSEVHEAESAERGLELVRQLPITMVIADIQMPGMDGLSFVAALRTDAEERVRGLPVILLTAQRDDGLRERGLAAGANEFLTKPVSVQLLKEAVERLVPAPSPELAR